MISGREPIRIAFLDEDHVMRLTRTMLLSASVERDRELRAFFAPEEADPPMLRELGAGLREQDGAVITLSNTPRALSSADPDIVIFRRGHVSAELFAMCPRLRLVQRLGASAQHIDLDAAARAGVVVSCIGRRTLVYTAEHAVLLMLALAKRLLAADIAVRATYPVAASGQVAYNWPGLTGIGGLSGRTLGIIGLGEVGTLVATRAAAFGMRVVYTNRSPLSPERELAASATYLPLPELLACSDVVSIHAPGSSGTILGAGELALMRPDAIVVNTSRGHLLDEDALYDALIAGRIAGAGLDVHVLEPRPGTDRFCTLDNVVLTPHVGAGSRLGVLDEIAAMFANMRAVLAGEPLEQCLIAPTPARIAAQP